MFLSCKPVLTAFYKLLKYFTFLTYHYKTFVMMIFFNKCMATLILHNILLYYYKYILDAVDDPNAVTSTEHA